MNKKKDHPAVKVELHQRNKHRQRYDFKELVESCPELEQYLIVNEYKDESIDFFNPEAVKTLNKALLMHHYGVVEWDIPENYLSPPIPGRADYIHHIAELLYRDQPDLVESKKLNIRCLDIGVGANSIYPIIGAAEYGWSFVGSDIDPIAIESAQSIAKANSFLTDKLELRLQNNPKQIFKEIIQKNEKFHLSICNPPFHSSAKAAERASQRKQKNLKKKSSEKLVLNFGGQSNELWVKGGEAKFVIDMVYQSKEFAKACLWFSVLVSKQDNLENIYKALRNVGAVEVKTLEMGQGNKVSRIVAWTYVKPHNHKLWMTDIK